MSANDPRRYFGTDGIRGVAGEHPLDRPTVTLLGHLLGELLAEEGTADGGVLIGGDTRASTPDITAWLTQGLAEAGVAARHAGVVPTPAVAWLTVELGAACGIAVSASHNPHQDNGIKLLGADGFKWPTALEARLEAGLHREAPTPDRSPAPPRIEPELAERYLEHLIASVADGGRGEPPLRGLRLLLDTANGAASAFAGPLFERLGAEVDVIHDRPDGRNINRDCGSTHPEGLAEGIVAGGFDLGVAFDGDADRAILVDERGEVRDGDAILYLWSGALRAAGGLEPPRIVATTMSNLGLERALAAQGIAIERCGVGDRLVVETLRREGLTLGGEQSGHIVHLGLGTTGDGLSTALQVAALRGREGRPLSRMLAGFRRFPQILLNVRVTEKRPFAELPGVQAAARRVEDELGADGRLVLRYSGTEPLARIMLEGPDQSTIEAQAERIAAAIREELS